MSDHHADNNSCTDLNTQGPIRETMDVNNRTPPIFNASSQGFLMSKKNSQCYRNCCCQPNMEFTVHEYATEIKQDDIQNHRFPIIMTIFEDASWCGRSWSFCCPGFRGTTYRVYKGDVEVSEWNSLPIYIHQPIHQFPISYMRRLKHWEQILCCLSVQVGSFSDVHAAVISILNYEGIEWSYIRYWSISM